MKWYIKKESGVWNIYLEQKYCKTDEPVLYCSALTKQSAEVALDRLNNPTFVQIAENKEFESEKIKKGKQSVPKNKQKKK
jgi:hypothetical protein